MRKNSGQTLIASMIVIVIILVLVVVFFGVGKSSPRKDKLGSTTPGLVRYAALDTKCQSDLQQVRTAIQTQKAMSGEDTNPASLEELKLPQEFYSCPVGHEKYVYDPATGKVHCPHPGHESY